jgi:hypothetical protein
MSSRNLVKLIVEAEKRVDGSGIEKKAWVMDHMDGTGLDPVDLSVIIDDIVSLLSSREGQRLFLHSTSTCKRMCFSNKNK